MAYNPLIVNRRGNRPTYVSGGVADDVMRPITGAAQWQYMGAVGASNTILQGAFSRKNNLGVNIDITNATGTSVAPKALVVDNGLVTLVGPENSPRTLAVLYWRRVA